MELKDKSIVVTGGSGFVGSFLCSKLKGLGARVFVLSRRDGDICKKGYFKSFQKTKIDYLFHLAGKTFVPESWDNPNSFFNINTIGALNVLEFCRKKNIYLTVVSSYIYGIPGKLPINENSEISPSNPYALSKYFSEQLCHFYAEKFGLGCTLIRPFNIYGPRQNNQFLIPILINQILHSPEIRVKDLTPKRDFLYIKDLIDCLVLTMRDVNGVDIYNVGSGYSLSVKEIISKIQNVAQTDKKVLTERRSRENEIPDTVADIKKLKKDFNWTPNYSFERGIEEILNFFL